MKKSKRLIPVILYGIFYMVCFAWLERMPVRYHIINSSLDKKIPFCEYFIVPYVLWFFYIAATVLYFAFFVDDETEYWNLIINLGQGYCKVGLVKPHSHSRIWDYAICVEVYSI